MERFENLAKASALNKAEPFDTVSDANLRGKALEPFHLRTPAGDDQGPRSLPALRECPKYICAALFRFKPTSETDSKSDRIPR